MSEAQIAATWWADKLRAKQLPGRDWARSGEIDPMAEMMSLMTAKLPEFPAEQVDAFELHLQVALAAEIEVSKNGSEDFHVSINVDYHPCHLLERAAQAAGIPTLEGFLPWKTVMWIYPGAAKLREGYGAQFVYLMGYEQALEAWEVRRKLWVDDFEGERTDVLSRYPDYAKLPPAESYAKIVAPPVKFDE